MPCVAMVMKVEPIKPAKIVYSIANMPFHFAHPCMSGFKPVVKKSETPKPPRL